LQCVVIAITTARHKFKTIEAETIVRARWRGYFDEGFTLYQ